MIMVSCSLGITMKYIRSFFFLCLITSTQLLLGINIITFFIHPFPKPQKATPKEKIIHTLKTPGKVSAKLFKERYLKQPIIEGIFSTYWGYLSLSNVDGQIIFPRNHTKDSANLLITEKITPIMMIGATVHHWELDQSVPAQIFSVERKQDPETKLYFWDTQKEELPSNNIIQLDTIVLFAKPKNIYIPTGITISDNKPQLFLPDIYAKKGMNKIAQALWLLNIKHFFSSLKKIGKKESSTYYSEQLNI